MMRPAHRTTEPFREDKGLREIQIDEPLPVFELKIFRRPIDAATSDVLDEDVNGRGDTQQDIPETFCFFGLREIGFDQGSVKILAAQGFAGVVQMFGIRSDNDDLST